ncbi:IS1-like element transposase [Flavobacterium pectinovorum]|nr:IS1-like element transposase [Flavobacterium pectinovorum]WKL48420.1 IS1-like element transposase [Flavobacterium pectinovorum]
MKIKCNFCNGKCIKNGFQSNGNQRYKCRVCQKRQQSDYTYNACKRSINQEIILFTKEGLGIRSTARILKISTTTLLKRIVYIARNITKPIISKGKNLKIRGMNIIIILKVNYFIGVLMQLLMEKMRKFLTI